MRKILYIFILIVCVVLATATYFYLYQNHRDVSREQVSYTVDVASLTNEFLSDENAANKKYLDKTILIKGNITMVSYEENAIVLDNKVFATFAAEVPSNLNASESVKVKGRFLGYDDLLEQLKIDQCTIE